MTGETFIYKYFALLYTSAIIGLVGALPLVPNVLVAIPGGVVFGNAVLVWYSRFPSVQKGFRAATEKESLPSDGLDACGLIAHNALCIFFIATLTPVFVKAYAKGNHLDPWHPTWPHWLVALPLGELALLGIIRGYDAIRNKRQR